MSCPLCFRAGHTYDRSCLGCAVRLVKSARSGHVQQEAMLAWVDRGGIERKRVIEELQCRSAQRELAQLSNGIGA